MTTRLITYIVTHKDNPEALPFLSSHWVVDATSPEEAIEACARHWWEPFREQLKQEHIAYPSKYPSDRLSLEGAASLGASLEGVVSLEEGNVRVFRMNSAEEEEQ